MHNYELKKIMYTNDEFSIAMILYTVSLDEHLNTFSYDNQLYMAELEDMMMTDLTPKTQLTIMDAEQGL